MVRAGWFAPAVAIVDPTATFMLGIEPDFADAIAPLKMPSERNTVREIQTISGEATMFDQDLAVSGRGYWELVQRVAQAAKGSSRND
jgi:hypothetical protein